MMDCRTIQAYTDGNLIFDKEVEEFIRKKGAVSLEGMCHLMPVAVLSAVPEGMTVKVRACKGGLSTMPDKKERPVIVAGV
jgi:hypothetical protein